MPQAIRRQEGTVASGDDGCIVGWDMGMHVLCRLLAPMLGPAGAAVLLTAALASGLALLAHVQGVLVSGQVETGWWDNTAVPVIAIVASCLTMYLLVLARNAIGNVARELESGAPLVAGAQEVGRFRDRAASPKLAAACYGLVLLIMVCHQVGNWSGLVGTHWQYPGGARSWPSMANVWFVVCSVVVGASVAATVYQALDLSMVVRRAVSLQEKESSYNLEISHPDGCGGLGVFGHLAFAVGGSPWPSASDWRTRWQLMQCRELRVGAQWRTQCQTYSWHPLRLCPA